MDYVEARARRSWSGLGTFIFNPTQSRRLPEHMHPALESVSSDSDYVT